jgi:MFS family permease
MPRYMAPLAPRCGARDCRFDRDGFTAMYSKRLVFAAACLGMLLFGIVFLSLGSVNNMLAARFGLSNNAIGTLAALLPAGILAGSLVFGPVVDRFGYRWMLVGASLVVGAALEGLAYAQSERLVQFLFFTIGFGGGILNGATNALAADVSEGTRGANLSLLGVFFSIGALLMPMALASLSEMYPLHGIVAGVGLLVLVPVAFCLAIAFPPAKRQPDAVPAAGAWRLLTDPFFLFAALAMAIQSGMEGMSNDWMTRYFALVTFAGQDVPERKVQLALVALTLAFGISRLVLAVLLRYVSSRVLLLSGVAIAAAGALILMWSDAYPISLVGAFIIGLGLAAAFPIVLGYVSDRYPQRSGTAFGMIFVVALVGNMIINKSFGYIAQQHGVERYTAMLLALLCCSVVFLTFMRMQMRANRDNPNER